MHGYLVGLEASVVLFNDIFFKFITSAESLSSAYTHVYLVVCSSLHGYLVWLEASVVLFNDFFKIYHIC